MSESWKKHDRECPPCADCGAVLYEKFWGNGGWAKTDRATGEAHSSSDCVRVIRARLEEARGCIKMMLRSALPSAGAHPMMWDAWGDASEWLGLDRNRYRIPHANMQGSERALSPRRNDTGEST